MVLDPHDTIVAIGTPPRPAGRGIVRLSGPRVVDCLSRSFVPDDFDCDWQSLQSARCLSGKILLQQDIPCNLLLWPTAKSYTRQPTAEINTFGAMPILEKIVKHLCEQGARLAEPGEFTLRAFLAGRLDLTQAEGVLGVIDARAPAELNASLEQLAGGLSHPLQVTRQQLIELLAELEAGLDFVEEDIEFISVEQLCSNLKAAQISVQETRVQLSSRATSMELPCVAVVGPPNAGKSSLFNELRRKWGADVGQAEAIVSQQAGTTRDYVTAELEINGIGCLLVDTAGEDTTTQEASIDRIAQAMTGRQKETASLLVYCRELTSAADHECLDIKTEALPVWTKSDQVDASGIDELTCSAVTGEGLDRLATEIQTRLESLLEERGSIIGSTTLRCGDSLENADKALSEALLQAEQAGGEELVAAEVRLALTEIGRVVGTVYTDDILDQIFGQFCIGK